jgi:hypothetical protein
MIKFKKLRKVLAILMSVSLLGSFGVVPGFGPDASIMGARAAGEETEVKTFTVHIYINGIDAGTRTLRGTYEQFMESLDKHRTDRTTNGEIVRTSVADLLCVTVDGGEQVKSFTLYLEIIRLDGEPATEDDARNWWYELFVMSKMLAEIKNYLTVDWPTKNPPLLNFSEYRVEHTERLVNELLFLAKKFKYGATIHIEFDKPSPQIGSAFPAGEQAMRQRWWRAGQWRNTWWGQNELPVRERAGVLQKACDSLGVYVWFYDGIARISFAEGVPLARR